MTRLTNRRKPHDLGRGNQQHMEDLVDFSLFKGLTRQVCHNNYHHHNNCDISYTLREDLLQERSEGRQLRV